MIRAVSPRVLFPVLTGLAFVFGFWTAEGSSQSASSATTFLTESDRSVREVAAVADPEGGHWISCLSHDGKGESLDGELALFYLPPSGPVLEAAWGEGQAIGPVALTALPGGGVYGVWESAAEGRAGRQLWGRAARLHQASPGETTLQLQEVEALTMPGSHPLQPHLATAADGSILLTWQEEREGHYRIFFSFRSVQGRWAEAKEVAPHLTGEAWRPRIAAAADGRVLIAFDAYGMNPTAGFDVYLAQAASAGSEFRLQAIAAGPTYQAWPEIAVDPQGRTWVAYEESHGFGQGGALRAFRRSCLLMVTADGTISHAPLPASQPHGHRGDFPKLAVDEQGLLLFRRVPFEQFLSWKARKWNDYPTWKSSFLRFDADGAATSQRLADSDGGNENDGVLIPGPEGFDFFWATDIRSQEYRKRRAFKVPAEGHWRLAHQRLGGPRHFPQLLPGPPPPLEQAWGDPLPMASGPAQVGSSVYGDLHRHTDLSRCGGLTDGTFLDSVRYARGPGRLSFLSITDHFQHMQPWSYGRQLRDVERWHAPGRLWVLPGMERMVPGEGHQNLIFRDLSAARHAGLVPSLDAVAEGSLVSIPHMTSSDPNPFDLQQLDPDRHRLVEIYQGLRGSYEGLPTGEQADVTEPARPIWPLAAAHADAAAGWWTRLAAQSTSGRAIGAVGSADHGAGGAGFTGVRWNQAGSGDLTRAALFDALAEGGSFALSAWDLRQRQDHFLHLEWVGQGRARQLRLSTDAPGLAVVELFRDGALMQQWSQPLSFDHENHWLLRPRFGEEGEALLRVSSGSMPLQDSYLRQPRPDLPARALAASGGSLTLLQPALVRAPADGDLVLVTGPSRGRPPVLEIELQAPGQESPQLLPQSLDLDALSPQLGRRLSLGDPEQAEPYVDVVLLGRELSPPAESAAGVFEVRIPLPEGGQAANFYARVRWLDGNFAWSGLTRG